MILLHLHFFHFLLILCLQPAISCGLLELLVQVKYQLGTLESGPRIDLKKILKLLLDVYFVVIIEASQANNILYFILIKVIDNVIGYKFRHVIFW